MAVNALMENFGLTSEEAFDFVQAGLQNGLDASGDFLDSIGEYSVQFAEGGADAGQFFSVLDTGLQAGLLGTDKAADLFKEFRVRIQDGSDATSDALEAIGIDADDMAERFADGSLTAIDAFQEVKNALRDVDDENVAFQSGVALLGTQFEDLGEDAVQAIDTMAVSTEEISDLTSDINAQYDTFGNLVEGLRRKALIGLEPIGRIMLDLATQALPLVEQAFAALEPILENLATALGLIAGGDIVGGLEAIFGEERTAQILAVAEAITDFITPIIDNIAQFVEWKDVLIVLGAVLGGVILNALIGLAAAVAPVIAVIGAAILIAAALRTAWENDFAGIRDFVAGIWEAIKTAWEAFRLLFQGDLQGFLDNMEVAWQTAWNAVVTFLGNLWVLIQPKLQELWESIRTWFETTDWEGLATTLMTFIRDKLTEFWTIVKPVIDEWWAAFKTWFEETDWQALGEQVITQLILKLAELGLRIIPKLQEMRTAFTTWFNNQDWGALGTSIIDGITSAISAGASAVVDALVGAVQGAISAAQAAMGSDSPSRVAAELIGRPFDEGIAMGINANLQPIEDAVQNAMGVMVGAANGGGNNFNTTINSNQPAMPLVRASRHMDKLGAMGLA
jgi:mannose/fructose-specific phosphotransferase system component IIA